MRTGARIRSDIVPFVIAGGGAAVGVMVALVLRAEWGLLLWADLTVGWVFTAAAALAWRGSRPVAGLLAAVALTWFVGSLVPFAAFWHRAPLIHVALRRGPRSSRAVRLGAIAVAYAVSAAPQPWSNEYVSIALAAALVAIAWIARAPVSALIAVSVFAGAIMLFALARLVVGAAAIIPALLMYDAAMVATAVVLTTAVRRPPARRVTDLIVDLGIRPREALRDELASAIGDPTLRIGVWDAGSAGYLAAGDPLDVPPVAEDRDATLVDVEGRPAFVLEHAVGALDDGALRDAVADAVRVTARNADLRALALMRNAELAASRRRILVAEDAARLSLSERADRLVLSDLDALAAEVADARSRSSSPVAERLDDAGDRIAAIRAGIEDAIAGLAPREAADGVEAAVRALATRSPQPIEVTGSAPRVDADIEIAVTLAIAEAVTNAVKHADAHRVGIELDYEGGRLIVVVSDDGRGGADAAGSGIMGLVDRIAAIGGTATVESSPGEGTRIAMSVLAAASAVTARAATEPHHP